MSRLGRKPLLILAGVEAEIDKNKINVKGPYGALSFVVPLIIKVEKREGRLWVSVAEKSKEANALQGTVRQTLANMLTGAANGWEKNLEVVGTGYRASLENNLLVLSLGFSHPVKISVPESVKLEVKENKIRVFGPDKALVGQLAAQIRRVRPPDPYKGKGIRYLGEVLKLKPGKAAKGVTGSATAK